MSDEVVAIPQAIDAEQQVLGAMLISPQALAIGLAQLKSDAFYRVAHRAIFLALSALFEQGISADQITLCDQLRSTNLLDQAGGVAYIAGLASEVATGANISYHARIVQDRYLRRQVQSIGQVAWRTAGDLSQEIAQIAAQADAGISSLSAGYAGEPLLIGDILSTVLDEMQVASQAPNALVGLPTGLDEIDSRLAGLQRGELTLLAARPSVGKTALALQIAHYAAANYADQGDVLFFSVEMPRKSIATRLLSNRAGIEYNRLKTGRLSNDEWVAVTRELGSLVNLPIHIDDTGGLTILEARARLRLLARRRKISLVVVDYLQLMSGQGTSREQEISSVSRGLKAVAKEIDAPILALSQMNRAIENRFSKMPQLSDLRESGSLEQDADAVIFLSEPIKQGETPQIELSIAKSRNGPKGSFFLYCDSRFFRFADPAPEYRQEPPLPLWAQ